MDREGTMGEVLNLRRLRGPLAKMAGQGRLLRERQRVAAKLMEHLTPAQLAFVRSPKRRKASRKNRRAGANEAVGCWFLEQAILGDGWVGRSGGVTQGQAAKNFWLRRKRSAVSMLLAAGAYQMTRRNDPAFAGQRVRFLLHRTMGSLSEVQFPDWGSAILIGGMSKTDHIALLLGEGADALWADECQDLPHLNELLAKYGPALSEHQGVTFCTGTPAADPDCKWGRICRGVDGAWELHSFYSWENPAFGETFAERYAHGVIASIRDSRDELASRMGRALTDEQLDALAELDESQVRQVAHAHIDAMAPELATLVKSLSPLLLREYFGRWTIESTPWVYASRLYPRCYWARATGLETMVRQLWETHQLSRGWRAILGHDPGGGGPDDDPTGQALLLGHPKVRGYYEVLSRKLTQLDSDGQFEAILDLAARLWRLGTIPVDVVVDSGGTHASTTKSWTRRAAARLRARNETAQIAVYPASKHEKFAHIDLMNADIASGLLHLLEGSAVYHEHQHLQIAPRDDPDQPRKEHKRRVVVIEGQPSVPGNDASDALLYAQRHWTKPATPVVPPAESHRPMSPGERLLRQQRHPMFRAG